MGGHHLILGKLKDYLTGQMLADTLDERIRQKLARLLVEVKGFPPPDIRSRHMLTVRCGDQKARIPLDFIVYRQGTPAMLVKYGPGSLVTRHRPVVAAAQIVLDRPVPVAVVTNGRDADVLITRSAAVAASGMPGIPTRRRLDRLVAAQGSPRPLTAAARERYQRIIYAYEVDGACPCDDTVCRL